MKAHLENGTVIVLTTETPADHFTLGKLSKRIASGSVSGTGRPDEMEGRFALSKFIEAAAE